MILDVIFIFEVVFIVEVILIFEIVIILVVFKFKVILILASSTFKSSKGLPRVESGGLGWERANIYYKANSDQMQLQLSSGNEHGNIVQMASLALSLIGVVNLLGRFRYCLRL